MDSQCLIEKLNVKRNPGMNQREPSCHDDGYYEPAQCTSPIGLCRCVDKEFGKPIQSGGLTVRSVEADQTKMNCKCAREFDEMIKDGCRMSIDKSDFMDDPQGYLNALSKCIEITNFDKFTDSFFGRHGALRCLPNGNYDPIQCMEIGTGETMCFCLDGQTMNWDKNSLTYVDSIDTLECFDHDVHSKEYWRPCEAKLNQIKSRKDEFAEEQVTYIPGDVYPICRSDGYYGKVQLHPDNVKLKFCSDPTGHQIEEFKSKVDSLQGRKMNCECAQARHYMTNNLPSCCPNGNYRGRQCVAGMCYCVDEFGRQIGQEEEQSSGLPENCPDYCCDEGPYKEDSFCYETKNII